MANIQRGVKRVCQSCDARFYDLGRSPIICPNCNSTCDPEAILRSRRNRPSATTSANTPKTVVADLEEGAKPSEKEAEIVLESEDSDIVGDENDDAGEDEIIDDGHDLVEEEFVVPNVNEDKTES